MTLDVIVEDKIHGLDYLFFILVFRSLFRIAMLCALVFEVVLRRHSPHKVFLDYLVKPYFCLIDLF